MSEDVKKRSSMAVPCPDIEHDVICVKLLLRDSWILVQQTLW